VAEEAVAGVAAPAPTELLPLALADLHRSLAVGARVDLPTAGVAPGRWADIVEGAGFRLDRGKAIRERTLPDCVGPDMRLLVVGLNPSLYAADAGVGFARPGNRFWPAALAAGLVTEARQPRRALVDHGIGMTDLVKRATRSAAELHLNEYRHGLDRVERLVAWLRPAVVCFLGLTGWRTAVDRQAVAGPQPRVLGGRPVYVMPNPSGANAHTRPAEFAAHLRAAVELAGDGVRQRPTGGATPPPDRPGGRDAR
jgi:TDG/mug DNA glycosylase family protein